MAAFGFVSNLKTMKILSKFLDSNERELKKLRPLVEEINALEPEIRKLSDGQLRAKTAELRSYKGLTLEKLLPQAFAVCREAIRRTVGEQKTGSVRATRVCLTKLDIQKSNPH